MNIGHPGLFVTLLLLGCASRGPALVRATAHSTVQSYVLVDAGDAPRGFRWLPCEHDLGCRVLVPAGWSSYVHIHRGTLALFVTEEPLQPPATSFVTGLTVNVIRNVDEKARLSAKDYLDHHIERLQAASARPADARLVRPAPGVFVAGLPVVREGPPGADRVRVAHRLIANEQTGTVYLASFEAPESQWQEAWPTGRQLLDHLAVDLAD